MASSASSSNPPFTSALLAGAVAGTTVDLSLYPLDTLKTRLQSSAGFFATGGFRGIYRGIGSVIVGSAPGAAFFFCTYETANAALARVAGRRRDHDDDGRPASSSAVQHALAATLGEVAACAVRVPTEVVKQRAQAGQHPSSLAALRAIAAERRTGGWSALRRALYRGWGITVVREVPFAMIQFPLWEAMKAWGRRRQRRLHPGGGGRSRGDVGAFESGLYGSAAGAVAAAITTPLDVLKTRIMLSKERQSVWVLSARLLRDHGLRPFFAGIGPRVLWISAGGAIFLGSYQWAANALVTR